MAATLYRSWSIRYYENLKGLNPFGDQFSVSPTFSYPCEKLATRILLKPNTSVRYVTGLQRSLFSTSVSRNTNHDRDHDKDDQRQINSLSLMKFPEIIWPSIFKSIKNYMLTYLVIKPYLDREFALDEFMKGAKQALLCVSKNLAEGNCDLSGLITEDALEEIKENVGKLDERGRLSLCIRPEDIYFAFPYQVGIMFDETLNIPQRFIEITVCFHCFPGFNEVKRNDPTLSNLYEHKDKIVICNYRFIREYTQGMQGNWIINRLNHFKPPMEIKQ